MTDLTISLKHELITIGVPLEGAANVFYGNEFSYRHSSFAESNVKKNHQAIYFHPARECVSAEKSIFHKVDTNYNLDYLLTKSLPG